MDTISDKRLYYEKVLLENDAIEDAAKAGIKVRTKLQQALDEFITSDPDLIEVKNEVAKLSDHELPILILGDTGTGKELIAKALHGNRSGNFVPVNCAGIPDTLIESEFFGHAKGAFTGATGERHGYIGEARNGTLFLDEIGDMPLLLQSKLLRVLQSKVYSRIGDPKPIKVLCRFISATNLTREELLDKHKFRNDLFYRLAGHILELKPLVDRVEDDFINIIHKFAATPEIATHINIKYSRSKFPGNVRELINLIQATNILYNPDPEVKKNHLFPLAPKESKL
jgi:transcriptional regulator with PAS, ATPase and Fis domain